MEVSGPDSVHTPTRTPPLLCVARTLWRSCCEFTPPCRYHRLFLGLNVLEEGMPVVTKEKPLWGASCRGSPVR